MVVQDFHHSSSQVQLCQVAKEVVDVVLVNPAPLPLSQNTIVTIFDSLLIVTNVYNAACLQPKVCRQTVTVCSLKI